MKPALMMLAVAMAPWLVGCVATAPEWEGKFGNAARQARAAQVIDPDAPSRNTGLAPTDGKAVAGAHSGYARSYGYAVREAAQPVVTISTTGSR